MVSEIRIYVEGGGDSSRTQLPVREGFSKFLMDLKLISDQKNIGWSIVACGSRGDAKNDFFDAIESHPDAFIVLLVDSEAPVNDKPWRHLNKYDKWQLQESHNDNYHLMVQVFESWLIADLDALKDFYGEGFDENVMELETEVEKISKKDVNYFLQLSTRNTEKGKYHKINHGPKILALLDVSLVRNTAPHCNRLFTTLAGKMGEAI